MKLPSFLQSSADPTQISLTIASGGKTLAGFVALLAVVFGIDPNAASSQIMNLVATATTLVTAAYTAYNAAEMMYGGIRKLVIYFGTGKATLPEPVTPERVTVN